MKRLEVAECDRIWYGVVAVVVVILALCGLLVLGHAYQGDCHCGCAHVSERGVK